MCSADPDERLHSVVSHLVLNPGSTLFCHKRMVYKFTKHPKYFDMYYNEEVLCRSDLGLLSHYK